MEGYLMVGSPSFMAALLVLAGHYGNGVDRKNNLEEDGFDYEKVQSCVNDLIKIIDKY